jgi:siroheme synthase-like protein
MSYYPIYLEMTGRCCAVIGGGAVAERKVEALLAAGAAVTIISPIVTDLLGRWVEEGRVSHTARRYAPGDIAGYELAFIATDDSAVNAAVYEEGRNRGVWVNAADDPAHCDFILPSVLRRGELTIAVSTGGKSPALSRSIREQLESHFSDDYRSLVEVAAEVRNELQQRSLRPGYEAWRRALNGDVREQIRRGDLVGAKNFLLKELGATPCE